MIVTILEILFALCAVVSSLFFVFVHLGWQRAMRVPPGKSAQDAVSIIIAAHNAAATLPDLFIALREQSWPRDLMQIIIVDDRSEDATTEVIAAHADDLPVDVLRVDQAPEGVSPKKHALHLGITRAAHERILLTDADCVPQPEWISAMLRVLTRGNDVTLGLAPLEARAGSASRYAAFESRRTMALMAAAAAWGKPYMAGGRSWGFTKEVYRRAGGLEPLAAHLGGDDDLLLQRFVRHGARVGVCKEPDAQVESPAPSSWRALYRQKLRHYRVSSSYRGGASSLLALFVLTETLTPLLGAALTVMLPGAAKIFPPLLVLWKFWYDTGFLLSAFRWMNGETSRARLAMHEAFHIFYAAVVGLMSFVKPPRW